MIATLSSASLRTPLPTDWELICGCDTGTYMAASFIAIPPGDSPSALVIEEFPNYRYVSHEIELLGMSIPEWARFVYRRFRAYRPGVERCKLWADPNTQFRAELRHYKLDLLPNHRGDALRVEVAREYMMAKDPQRLFLAPWLEVLPYEIEAAKWPDDTTSAGKFMRIKHHDHLLDTVEHALSRRPRSAALIEEKKLSFLEQQFRQHRQQMPRHADIHLGRH